MGAGNVLRAYQLYAGKVPPLSMQVLAYMAAVSIDADREPWFSMGQESIAAHALGRKGEIDRAALAAVERALKPLFEYGAITTIRRASARKDSWSTAKYRLGLGSAKPVDIDALREPDG
jgi:hypothetical protein